jgi:acetyl-CoA carboxylase biotin carboxyl carrier protein
MNRERIRELTTMLKGSRADELEVREGDLRVRLRKQTAVSAVAEAGPIVVSGTCTGCNGEQVAPPEQDNLIQVKSQLVGLFHRGRRPEVEPLVQAEDKVSAGQLLGTIEALRNFTDVTSPVDGTIVQVIAEDGQPVQYGDPLMAIQPSV